MYRLVRPRVVVRFLYGPIRRRFLDIRVFDPERARFMGNAVEFNYDIDSAVELPPVLAFTGPALLRGKNGGKHNQRRIKRYKIPFHGD